ncbi:hypothetical protein T439DRAFT_328626 [Meredithblackwellia eburnea MCA 4105]
MLSSLFSGSKDCVKIVLEDGQEDVWLHPAQDAPGSFNCTVVLNLHSPKLISELSVTLEGLCSIYASPITFGLGVEPESYSVMSQKVDITPPPEELPAGQHVFPCNLSVPPKSPITIFGSLGKIQYKARASVKYAVCKSTLTSDPVEVWLGALEVDGEGFDHPIPTDRQAASFSENLGAFKLEIKASHLSIASLVRINLTLVDPPQNLQVETIRGRLGQIWDLAPREGSKRPNIKPPLEKIELIRIEEIVNGQVVPSDPVQCVKNSGSAGVGWISLLKGELAGTKSGNGGGGWSGQLKKGESFTYSGLFRLPITSTYGIQPSSLEHSEGNIRAEHIMGLDVHLAGVPEAASTVSLMTKVKVGTCCSLRETVDLPAYSERDPCEPMRPVDERCKCYVKLEELMEHEKKLGLWGTPEPYSTNEVHTITKS